MIWQREEEGMAVTATLHQTTEKPLAPWDRAQGLWLLDTVEQDGVDLTGTYDPHPRDRRRSASSHRVDDHRRGRSDDLATYN